MISKIQLSHLGEIGWSLNTLMDELLPTLKHDGVLVGVFFTPSGKGVAVPADELAAAVGAELQNY